MMWSIFFMIMFFHINFSHNNEPPSELSYKVTDASLAMSENRLWPRRFKKIIPVPCSFKASINSPTNGTFYNKSFMLAGLVRAANWSIVPAAGNPNSAAKS